MRLLLDESVPRRFRHALPTHTVKTAVETGWSGKKNGQLLTLAAADFEAFITVDQNLSYQQRTLRLFPLPLLCSSLHQINYTLSFPLCHALKRR